MAATTDASSAITHAGVTEEIAGSVVTGDFFKFMAVRPRLGRTLNSTDTRSVGTNVVVLSDSLWRRLLGADPGTRTGATAIANGIPRETLQRYSTSVTPTGRVDTPNAVPEEAHVGLFLCRGAHQSIQHFWPSMAGRY